MIRTRASLLLDVIEADQEKTGIFIARDEGNTIISISKGYRSVTKLQTDY